MLKRIKMLNWNLLLYGRWLMVCVLLLLAGCTPVALANATPYATPSRGMILGRVLWAGKPVAEAIVTLRLPDWRTNQAATLLSAQADGNGVYMFPDPPIGEFEVVPQWPEGVTDGTPMDPGIPVSLSPGATLEDVNLFLTKKMRLETPAEGATVAAAPTLAWDSVPDAAFYRVIVVNPQTMEGFFGEDTMAISLTLTQELPPGAYSWTINALTRSMDIVAVATGTFVVAP